MAPTVLWFRRDLRLLDLPALTRAWEEGVGAVVPLFVVDPQILVRAGPNRRRFLVDSLIALNLQLDGRLVVRQGDPETVVPSLAAEVGAKSVVVTADFSPFGRRRDAALAAALKREGRALLAVDSPYAVAPGTVVGVSGAPLRVFTPFHRAWQRAGWMRPQPPPKIRWLSAPGDIDIKAIGDQSDGFVDLPEWWEGLPLGVAKTLPPGGAVHAMAQLEAFLDGPLETYADDRQRPAVSGTSGLSPYLRFGCIHPRTILERLPGGKGPQRMEVEIAWREFYADVLWHHPQSVSSPMQPFGEHLRWDTDVRARNGFRAWALGQTGFPLVDAGMRQLLAEGRMHNRVRMVAASFLVKDLHIDWRRGARWFMWHLVDGDVASNQHGWQWVAGTGTDAAPFYRVFNPSLQQDRFDPEGEYVRRYIPELSAMDGSYPSPIVDHGAERIEALARFNEAKQATLGSPDPQ